MKKIHKSVLKSSLVMLVLFAVAGSGVAQAQECLARASGATTARAEGVTEPVGGIELLCREPEGFGFGVPTDTEISIELNTQVTNQITVAANIIDSTGAGAMALTYMGTGGTGTPSLGNAGDYTGTDKEVLSEDGTTITWKITSADLGFSSTAQTVTIAGILANTSMLGDGGEVSAVVRVNGTAVHSGSLKLADVKTALEIKVTAAEGAQCESTDTETAMITIKEAFMAGISDNEAEDAAADDPVTMLVVDDGLVVDFLNIPAGVTVTVPNMIALPEVVAGDAASMTAANITFAIELVTGRTVGVTENEDDDTKSDVTLSPSGSGRATYTVTGMDDRLDGEWVILPVNFKWTAGNVIDMGEVDVSLHPVSMRGDANLDDENVPTPRFAETNNPMTVISVTPCETTLLFPFVTNQAGFDTGIAISNTSAQAGSCTISYHGADAPDPMESSEVAAERQLIFLVSSGGEDDTGIDGAPGFQGYIMADCGFQDAHGFGFVSNGYPGGPSTLAQGYLAVVE